MIVDVAPLLRGEVSRIEIDYMLSPEQMDGIRFDSDARVVGCMTDNAGYMRLTLKAELSYHGECARCLAPVDGVFSLDFERTVVVEGSMSEEQLDEMAEEYVALQDGKLDVDEPLREELMLCFPSRLLCEEDCPGLCPHCGRPKREGDCGCAGKEIDPRWAALKGFFDDDDKDGNN